MRIGIDITPLQTNHKTRGVGFYTRNLVDALKKYFPGNEYILYKRGQSLPKVDVSHYPYFDFYFLTLPIYKKVPTVVTVHDIIPLIFKKYYPAGIKGKLKFQLQKFSFKNTAAVICDSQNSKKDIVKYLNYPEDKIHVVYLAPSEIFKPISNTLLLRSIRVKYKLPRDFILYVGDVNYNKNIPRLLEAFSKILRDKDTKILSEKKSPNILISQYPSLSLVLVGEAAQNEKLKETQELINQIKKLGLEDRVLRLGFVPDEDLVAIYNLATIYIQPSLYEGFGLPVLEAMFCGTPVICSNTSSLPEIAGEAIVYIDPENVESIKEGLEKVIGDKKLQEELSKKGLLQAKKFSWEKTARETLNVYQKVCR